MVAHGTPCLGPVTHAGCGALCPSYDRGCYGCFGPAEDPSPEALGAWLLAHGLPERDVVRLHRTFYAGAPAFRDAGAPAPAMADRVLLSKALARVEGEGALHVRLRDGRVEDVRLRIYEPPRFFEAFLRGRAFTEVPGHHRADLRHLPRRLPDELVRGDGGRLRRRRPRRDPRPAATPLLRRVDREPRAARRSCSRRPDLLGRASAFDVARDHPDLVTRALALKKAGNALMRAVGGREIHPVNVRVGGFYRAPTRRELDDARAQLQAARGFAAEAVAWTAALPFPDVEEDFTFVALRDDRALRDRGRPDGLEHGPRRRPAPTSPSTSSRSRCRTRPRSRPA